MSNYTAQVGGATVNVLAGSINIQNQIGQRSTGSLAVWSDVGTVWQYGTQVQVYDETAALVYSGYVAKDKARKTGARQGTGKLEHNLTLMDNCYRADKRVAFASYTNVTAGAIAQNLVDSVLYQEGVTYTASSIAAGTTIPAVIWEGKQISAALDWLAKTSGYWWNITNDGVLFFQPFGGIPAPFVLDGTQVEAGIAGGLSVEYGNDMYVNTQYTKGGTAERGTSASPLHETFKGNSLTRSFTLSFPVSTLYTVELNGVDITANVLTKGSNGGHYYYQPGDATIAQDAGQTLLTSSDTLDVFYAGRVPAIGKAQNAGLIATQQSREGSGSGIVESVYSDNKIHTLPAALQIASALLSHYGADMTVLEFDTHAKGLLPGQMLTANLTDFALNNKQMLVTTVAINDQTDEYNAWFHVSAVGGPYDVAQFQTFWQNLMSQQSDPADRSDVNDVQLTPISTSTFTHSPLFSASGFTTQGAICGTNGGTHTMVCGNWTVC